MTLHEMRQEIIRLSGSGKKVAPNARRHGIYTSFTVPGLDDMLAVRDTRQRFDDFGVPQELEGKTAIDVGCNVGAVSLELARRGAVVDGIEYREDRVALCTALFAHYEYVGQFYQTDLNAIDYDGPLPGWRNQHDLVLCCSVDEYMKDVQGFYRLLLGLAKPGGTLYLESNVQHGVTTDEVLTWLGVAGWRECRYLGNGHSGGIARKRKLYTGRRS